jgi:phosphoenolpyruvate carboxykinase (ATP)
MHDGSLDFADKSITENTRAAYPLEHIEKAVISGTGGHPKTIIFLTADAWAVLPPIAKLNHNAAIYHFLSGYTSKLAGTERGVITPSPTFSPYFGAPFMPLKPIVYANLLRYYLDKHKSEVYLVNTGWVGGEYGVGKRISIKDTRAIVRAALSGKITGNFRADKIFNLSVPTNIPGVKSDIMNPKDQWEDKNDYDSKAQKLASLFVENFAKFKDIPKEVINSGPTI